ncbi:MAG TPA: hypothetical protein VGQ38_12640 [Gaiellaceae bacterium]|nr:hypothetical protein [Gaiellaceae bacterium]
MSARAIDLLGAGSGIAFVALELIGFGLGGSLHQLTVTSSTADVASAIATTASTASWISAYLSVLGYGAFLAFAVWASTRVGGGSLARAAATSYATLCIASLAVVDALAYRAGNGLTVPMARTLSAVNEALFVTTWFVMAFFLLATGVAALREARRLVGSTAVAAGLFTLLATAVSINSVGQLSTLVFFVWVIGASIGLGLRHSRPARRSQVTPALADGRLRGGEA